MTTPDALFDAPAAPAAAQEPPRPGASSAALTTDDGAAPAAPIETVLSSNCAPKNLVAKNTAPKNKFLEGEAATQAAPESAAPERGALDGVALESGIQHAAPESGESAALEGAVAARRLRHLSAIGLALSAERDIQRLLGLILSASRELTGADGGTLYIVEENQSGQKSLFFRAAQNDSISIESNLSFAVSPSSLAGYAALSGEMLRFDDVYLLDPNSPFKFNPSFDADHGYRTRSILIVPLQDHVGQVIGVLQLINRKRHPEARLRDMATIEREVIPFDAEMTELAAILASQASVALNNTLLLREIEELFEALVVAASSAIEDRDPTTSGHSRRVTNLTLALAQAVARQQNGPLAHIQFSPAQLKELRYAALLHDFGKIGVREAVLTKSHKIEAPQFEAIQNRILVFCAQIEAYSAQKCLRIARDGESTRHGEGTQNGESTRDARIAAVGARTRTRLKRLHADAQLLNQLNDPAQDASSNEFWQVALGVLKRLQKRAFKTPDGPQPLLRSEEADALRVRRGTLTPDEFHQIQNHAQMSFEFLKQIPWTPALAQIPVIARSHHERLDGSGYPQHLGADEIPFGAKMMAIADVYDALTASDRPYKRAMTPENALQILQKEAEIGKIDPAALQIFIAEEIWRAAGE